MSEKNPYGEAFDASRHVEPEPVEPEADADDDAGDDPLSSPEHPVAEADVIHLKAPGGSLMCGAMPHGVTATLSAKGTGRYLGSRDTQVTCGACKTAHEAAQNTPV